MPRQKWHFMRGKNSRRRQSLFELNRAIFNIASATMKTKDFCNFHLAWKVGGKSFMTFSFKPRFGAGKRLFRFCGFVVTSYGTSKSFSFVFLKQHSLADLRCAFILKKFFRNEKKTPIKFLSKRKLWKCCAAFSDSLIVQLKGRKMVKLFQEMTLKSIVVLIKAWSCTWKIQV